MGWPYIRQTEYDPSLAAVPLGYGQPGRSADPSLWDRFGAAFAELWHTPTIMNADAKTAYAAGDNNPQSAGPISDFLSGVETARSATADLLSAWGTTWQSTDPDTGQTYYNRGGEWWGQRIAGSINATGQWVEQVKGLFNLGYPTPEPVTVSNDPVNHTAAVPGAGLSPAVILGALGLVYLLAKRG